MKLPRWKTPRRPFLCAFLFLLSCLCGCTSLVPSDKLPESLSKAGFGDPVKVVAVPLPVVASDPNDGLTVGALTAFLFYNKQDEVGALVTPMVDYNPNYGAEASVYGELHPSANESLSADLSQSQKTNYDYEFDFSDDSWGSHKLDLNASVFAFADGSARFFGFHAGAPKVQQSNFNDEELGFALSASYPLGHNFRVVLSDRLRDVGIHGGAIKNLPFIRNEFPNDGIPGDTGFDVHLQGLSLVYSTLNSRDTPTSGGYARAFVEQSLRVLGSTSDYKHYGLDLKEFVPVESGRLVSVFQATYNQTEGSNVPFLEQSILGGEDTLRGYGRDRFVDRGSLLFNAEERIRIHRWDIFHVLADWELAPFVDYGTVMRSIGRTREGGFELNPGLGVRAIVRPNIVARIDLGYSRDGSALFMGLGYPF